MRQGIQLLLLAAFLALVGLVAYRFVFPDDTYSLLVKSAERTVLESPDGTTRSLSIGDVVSQGQRLRTAEGGSALVASGESEVQIKSSTSMLIKKLDETGMDIELENGRFSAHVRHGAPSVRVSNGGRSVYATDADFELAADPDGTFALDAARGTVALEGLPGIGSVGAGERLTHVPGSPAVKSSIPEQLLLEVAWPDDNVTRDAQMTVHGRTDPYARVKVGRDGHWQEVRADAEGSFRTDIALEEGPNPLEVRARDAMGQEEHASTAIERRTKPPSGTVGVDYSRP
jgi:hypothetical protein